MPADVNSVACFAVDESGPRPTFPFGRPGPFFGGSSSGAGASFRFGGMTCLHEVASPLTHYGVLLYQNAEGGRRIAPGDSALF